MLKVLFILFFAEMASNLQIQGDESVLLRITHSNIKSFSADVRFSLQVCNI